MDQLGRTLILIGLAIAALGAALWLLSKTGFSGLPGDIKYESNNVRVYVPIGTSILLSIVLTLGVWLWRHFQNK